MQKVRKESNMIQWIGVAVAIVGFIYSGLRDYQNGDIRIPQIAQTSQNEQITQKPQLYPIQTCLMAYDPNIDKVFYLHEDNSWRDYPPTQKKIGTYYY